MNRFDHRITFGLGSGLTPAVKNLIITTFAVYVLQWLTFGLGKTPPLLNYFALTPFKVTNYLTLWQLVTYQFLHSYSSILHILFNMFVLWMFGPDVERYLGSKQFLRFYLFSGIGAGMFFILFNWNSPVYVIGASGAIYGVLVAFAVIYPNRIITLLLFFVLPVSIKAKHLVAILIGLSVFSGIQGQIFGVQDGVAHLAHLGGALVGFLLLKSDELSNTLVRKIAEEQLRRRTAQKAKRQAEQQQKRKEIDKILDRINEVGFKNISEEEKRILKKASEYLEEEKPGDTFNR